MAENFVAEIPDVSKATFRRNVDSVTITSAAEIRSAAEAIHKIAQSYGFRIAVSADISSKAHLVDAEGELINKDIFGWVAEGERWWEDTRLALSSPLPRACRYESEPIWCNADGFHGHWQNEYLDEIDLKDFYETGATAKSAILIPVHLPFGQIAAVSFTPIDYSVTDLSEPYRIYSDFLSIVTSRFVTGYVLAMRKKHRMPTNCILSKREAECLHWAAIGKTDKEISMILSLSHATIRYHVNRAGQKLNSVNRGQTIFKAGQLGYLGATD
ncbi:helix-turn-helix transcriptional regulator [Sphingorhabdus sp. EL138]|jgi:DNA-binding CsgD family transcriptional regulator|uniref:helix-turn-helix domain-containing protein n=1 Tax=Sphingorhabdus sp. EL138 TaxID=2073156 RepID=UPI000D68B74C|nr:helix-turn-helix transcriptional regulator [Sphingorhabdus sp. EL138]